MKCGTCLKILSEEDIGIELNRGYICNNCFDYKCKFCKNKISRDYKYVENKKEFINVCEPCKFLKIDYYVLK